MELRQVMVETLQECANIHLSFDKQGCLVVEKKSSYGYNGVVIILTPTVLENMTEGQILCQIIVALETKAYLQGHDDSALIHNFDIVEEAYNHKFLNDE